MPIYEPKRRPFTEIEIEEAFQIFCEGTDLDLSFFTITRADIPDMIRVHDPLYGGEVIGWVWLEHGIWVPNEN